MKPYIQIALFISIILMSCDSKPEGIIQYEVLREWNTPAGGIGMDILVSQEATKEEVMRLASYLRKRNLRKSGIFINIFDLKEAWQNRNNESYPEEKYHRHFLVQVMVNPNTGYDRIQWNADSRGY